MKKNKGFTRLTVGQGLYYGATGIWPLLHLSSFMRVTGPKVDGWLVKTVGALVAVSGVALISAGRAGRITPETVILGAGQPVAFILIDSIYAAKGRISRIYLADAALQLLLLAGWWGRTRRG